MSKMKHERMDLSNTYHIAKILVCWLSMSWHATGFEENEWHE